MINPEFIKVFLVSCIIGHTRFSVKSKSQPCGLLFIPSVALSTYITVLDVSDLLPIIVEKSKQGLFGGY